MIMPGEIGSATVTPEPEDQEQDASRFVDRSYALAFADWFGLQPQPSRILATLYRAPAGLAALSLARRHLLSIGAVHRYVCELRKALDSEALDTTKVDGYRLTDEGMAECRAALWQIGEVLRTAS